MSAEDEAMPPRHIDVAEQQLRRAEELVQAVESGKMSRGDASATLMLADTLANLARTHVMIAQVAENESTVRILDLREPQA